MASTDAHPTSSDGTLAVVAEIREGEYGAKVAAVEPGGAEFIPLAERHGSPLKLFWTWMSPNMEFATVFLGVLAVGVFQQTLWQAVGTIVLGTALGSLTHAVLSARGPSTGVPQMVLSRISFGFYGNVLPAGLNAVVAGIGWFAVNSVSGAFALNSLIHLPVKLSLLVVVIAQIVIAFLGHNFIHSFERLAFPLLALAFVLATFSVFGDAHPSAAKGGGGLGAFLIMLGATFGYAAGWNPYATDYTRYLKPDTSKLATGLWAGLGVFVSCVILESVGAASATIATSSTSTPTEAFITGMPTAIAKLTLLAIVIGAVSANAINVYSGAMSFMALGIRIPLHLARAIVAVVFGVVGFATAWGGLNDAGQKYENFLLIISYWIGPWLAVFFTDQYLRRRHEVGGFLFDRMHNPFAGWVAMAIGMAVSIPLFSNQTKYVGLVPKHVSSVGDITFEVGFVVAAVVYYVLFQLQRDRTDEALVLPD